MLETVTILNLLSHLPLIDFAFLILPFLKLRNFYLEVLKDPKLFISGFNFHSKYKIEKYT